MSGKSDLSGFTRPKSSSHLAPRKKRVNDAWVGGQSKSPTELSIKKQVNDASSTQGQKNSIEKLQSTSKLLESNMNQYENTPKSSINSDKNSLSSTVTPETLSKYPEKKPESSLKSSQRIFQSLTKSPNKNIFSESKSLKIFKNPLEISDSQSNISNPSLVSDFISTDESASRTIDKSSKPNLPLSPKSATCINEYKQIFSSTKGKTSNAEPKANIPHATRPAFSSPQVPKPSLPLSPKTVHSSPSRYSNRNSYDIEDEKMEMLKQKQNNWPWAYRLTDKYSPFSGHKKLSGSNDIQSSSLSLPEKNFITDDCSAHSKDTSQKGCILKAALERLPNKIVNNDKLTQSTKEIVQQTLETEDFDEDKNKGDNKIKELFKQVVVLKEKEEALNDLLKKNTEKHQNEVKNYSKEIALKDKKIVELTAMINKNSEMPMEYKKKIGEIEKNPKEGESDSKTMLVKQGMREIDYLNGKIKEFKIKIEELEKEKLKQSDDSNKMVRELNEVIMGKEEIIRKTVEDLRSKDRQLADSNDAISKLEDQINELKKCISPCDNSFQDKTIQEKLDSCNKSYAEVSDALKKETVEKETLIKKIEVNDKFHNDEVSKLKTEIERLRKIVREKCDEKKLEDYEREKKNMQDKIDTLSEVVKIKDDILCRREDKT